MGFKWKLVLTMTGLQLLAVVLVSAINVNSQQRLLHLELAQRQELLYENLTFGAKSQLLSVRDQLQNSLASYQLSDISDTLRQSTLTPHLLDAYLVRNGAVIMRQTQSSYSQSETPPSLERLLKSLPETIELIDTDTNTLIAVSPLSVGIEEWGLLVFEYDKKPLNDKLEEQKQQGQQAINHVILQTSIATIVVLLLIIAVAFYLTTRITHPLSKLTSYATQIGSRKFLSEELDVKDDGEIGRLAAAFKQMNDRLRSSYSDLESQVDQRTKQLRSSMHQLQQAKEDAEKAAATKSIFLAKVSHEIRTPMNGVIGLCQLLHKTELSTPQKDLVSKISNSGETLLRLINDLLDFSKVEAGKMTIEKLDFSLPHLIEQSLQLCQNKADEKELSLVSYIAPDVPTNIIGDPLRIQQIFTNLISNAVKFTPEGAIHVKVFLEREFENHDILLHCAVIDSGIGMTQEQQDKLFQSFTQADDSVTRRFGGTGLGLVISKQIVELMEGDIWVESEVDLGSEFHFTLKLGVHQGMPSPSEQQAHGPINEIIPPDYSAYDVLVVEDNPINREIIIGYLEDTQVKYDVAENGLDALNRLYDKYYDLILMDIQMPEMDGLTATSHIRANSKFDPIPIIAMTANAFDSDIKNCLDAGMNAHISKPIHAASLYQLLNEQLDENNHLGDDKQPNETRPRGEDQAAEADAQDRNQIVQQNIGFNENNASANGPDKNNGNSNSSILDQLAALNILNISGAIANMAHKERLYIKTLSNYVTSPSNIGSPLIELYDDKDWKSLERYVHSLKSNAGYIGATVLQEQCQAIERTLKIDYSALSRDPLVEAAATADQLLERISPFFSAHHTFPDIDYLTDHDLAFLLVRLYQYLSSSDMEAEDLIQEIIQKLKDPTRIEQAASIQKLIVSMEYEKALELCARLLIVLRSPLEED
jgi:signal transduction histidine kinase/CheY-like chemotaxis protein/HPt (histidine-containing phosphotransfer) domain-containing protein